LGFLAALDAATGAPWGRADPGLLDAAVFFLLADRAAVFTTGIGLSLTIGRHPHELSGFSRHEAANKPTITRTPLHNRP
jgi:hypothetical protein